MITNSFVKGEKLKISGTVEKIVKREEQFRLIVAADVGFTVFADYQGDSERLKQLKIKKGSQVTIQGIVATFGTSAVCLSECKLKT